MRVKIGAFPGRINSSVHERYMDWKYGRYEWEDSRNQFERFLERLEGELQTVYNFAFNWYLDNKERKVSVKLDYYDHWDAAATMAHVILPLLVKIQETKQGAPWTDDQDVPEGFQRSHAVLDEDGHSDSLWFERWDWILREMIWAFEQKLRDWEEDFYKFEDVPEDENDPDTFMGLKCVWEDRPGRDAHQARMQNGFRLFGVYFECLWD